MYVCRSSYGAASLDSTINVTSRGVDQGASSSLAQGAASTRPSSARNPIITADSIINTLQMEMATVGLTAAAISAASRYLDTTSEVGAGTRTAAERPAATTTIAPRPSLGRVDPVSSLPDNLASLLVSDQTSSAQFSSLLATPEPSSRQSRLASMFTSETINLSGGQEPASLTLHQSSNGGRLASLLSSDGNQLHLNNLLGTDIAGEPSICQSPN